jgi:hypothetical protein
MPQDSEPGWRISMFARVDDAIRRASIDYGQVRESGAPPQGASVSSPRACSLPDRGACDADECGGGCELKRVYGDRDGFICWCPDEAEGDAGAQNAPGQVTW